MEKQHSFHNGFVASLRFMITLYGKNEFKIINNYLNRVRSGFFMPLDHWSTA